MIEGILICMVFMIILCLLISAYDCNRFITVRYEVRSDKITKPCKLVLLSDLHNKSYGKDHEKLIREIDAISPYGVSCSAVSISPAVRITSGDIASISLISFS